MDTGAVVQGSGGYSADFEAVLDDSYKCSICLKALKDPVQTPCGHRFCEKCLEPLLRTVNTRCPVDGKLLQPEEIFRDAYCKREVLQLVCFCKNKALGCEWRGELFHLKEHEKACNHREVPCPNPGCTQFIPCIKLKEHTQEYCQFKTELCPHCGQEVKAVEQEEHTETCPRFPVTCIAGCGATDIHRNEMDDHLANDCLQAEVPCVYSKEGCQFRGSGDQLREHLNNPNQTAAHLRMVYKALKEMELITSDLSQKVQSLINDKRDLELKVVNLNESLDVATQSVLAYQQRFEKVERNILEHRRDLTQTRQRLDMVSTATATMDQLTRHLEEIKTKIRDQEKMVSIVEREIMRLDSRNFGTQIRPQSEGLTSCEGRVDRTEHQLALHDIQLAEHDIKLQMLEATSYDGTYLWKINDWPRRFQDSASNKTPSIYSPPFFIGRFGYKVCARVYPGGDGVGKGTHVSLFFVIMRGEYDELLQWPFRQKVTFRLLDQDHQRDVTDAFKPDPKSSSFRKPTTNMNIASGCPQFVLHSDLQEGGYIRNETIFIKISVDMTGYLGP